MSPRTVYGKGYKITVDDRRLQRMRKELRPKAGQLIDKTAFDAQGIAQNEAPVDTGALRNSLYVVSDRTDGFRAAARLADDAQPGVEVSDIPAPRSDMEARLGPSVEYGIYQELGTRFQPGKAFLKPAAEKVWPGWARAWKQLLRGL